MPRKLFPYGKFLGLETATGPFNKGERYLAWSEGAWTDFRGQLHKGPGQTIPPASTLLCNLDHIITGNPGPRVHAGSAQESLFKGDGHYQHMWNVVHVGADNVLKIYFAGADRDGQSSSVSVDNSTQQPDNAFECLVVEDMKDDMFGQFVAWGDATTSGHRYPLAEHGDYANINSHSDPDALGGTAAGATTKRSDEFFSESSSATYLSSPFVPVNPVSFRQKVFLFHENAKTVTYDVPFTSTVLDRHRFHYAAECPTADPVTISANTVTKTAHGLDNGDPISLSFDPAVKYDPPTSGGGGSPANTSTLFTGTSGEVSQPSHGLIAGQQVSFHSDFYGSTNTSSLPTGFAENTKYYVVSSGLTTDTFKVSATEGGAVLTTSGYATAYTTPFMLTYSRLPSGVHRRKTYYVVNSQTDTFQISETVGGSALSVTGTGYGGISIHYWSAHNKFPNGGFGAAIQNRLVVAGLDDKETELHISALSKEYDWRTNTSDGDTALATDGAIIDVKDQFSGPDKIKGLGVLEGDKLVVFGENETLIYITDTDINQWQIATDFRVGIGLLGRNTIANIGQDLFFCSRSGIHSIKRAVSGLTLETKTETREITDLWLKLVDEAPKSGLVDADSYHDLYNVFPEPHAWWDNDIGHYTVAFPTSNATKWAQIIYVYEKGSGRGEFRSFSYTPADSPKNKMATCGSYFQVGAGFSDEFYSSGVARNVIGTTQQYCASGIAGDFSGHFFDVRTPVLWQGQPDTYKYYKRLLLRCVVLYDPDRLYAGGGGLYPEYDDFDMQLRIRVFDDLGQLKHTATVRPDMIRPASTHLAGTVTQFTPNETRARGGNIGAEDESSIGTYKDQKNPIEVPMAVRARGVSIRFDNDTTQADSNLNNPSYQLACGFLIQDFGLIVDTK